MATRDATTCRSFLIHRSASYGSVSICPASVCRENLQATLAKDSVADRAHSLFAPG
jgi:hypothetical protein